MDLSSRVAEFSLRNLLGHPLGEQVLGLLGILAVLVAHPAEESGELAVAAVLGPPRQSFVPVSVLHGHIV